MDINKKKTHEDNNGNGYENWVKRFAESCVDLKQQGRSISIGKMADESSVSKEIEELICDAFFILGYSLGKEDLSGIVYDLLNLIDENDISHILPIFISKHKPKDKRNKSVSDQLGYLAALTANAFGRLGYDGLKNLLLERLCRLSRQRNKKHRHREFILKVLVWLGDGSPEISAHIASINREYFERDSDEYSAMFFGLYGSLLGEMFKYDEATEYFRKRYRILLSIYGEDNIETMQAKYAFLSSSFSHTGDRQSREDLEKFINDINSNKYRHIDRNQLKSMEGAALLALLTDKNKIVNIRSYDHYLSLFEDLCENYGGSRNPYLNQRFAKTLRGRYFCETGNFIKAEKILLEAIECELPESAGDVFTIPQVKVELLIAYKGQNDFKKILPLLEELIELLDSDPQKTGLTDEYKHRILTVYSLMATYSYIGNKEMNKETLINIKEWLHDCCAAVANSSLDFPGSIGAYVELILASMTHVMLSNTMNQQECILYFKTLLRIERDNKRFPISQSVRVNLYLLEAILLTDINESHAEKYIAKAVDLADKTVLPPGFRNHILIEYALIYAKAGKRDAAYTYAQKALLSMEEMWKSCVRYLNDERLHLMVMTTQIQFYNLYSMLRTIEDPESTYERVLQFKELASLAIRERNRIIRTMPADTDLLKKIRSAQDRLAAIEAESLFRDNPDDYVKLKEELRRLETEFAQQFPQSNSFVQISFDNVKREMPDNSVVIEYFMYNPDFEKLRDEGRADGSESEFDVFITQKKNGICNFRKISIYNARMITNNAEEFVKLLQAEARGFESIDQIERVDEIRSGLYKDLIAPIFPYVEGFETIFIAPAELLTNLPFEILYDEDEQKLEDCHTVIKIECARDFLYKFQSEDSPKESLIIGNPDYELRERDLGKRTIDETGNSRMTRMDLQSIVRLPFSQFEAERTGKYLGNECYTGSGASKKLLFAPEKYRVIHVATHGYFDIADENEKEMYSSCLLFSGVCNWLRDGSVSEIYGNGIATADEISRLDLTSTDLVVLSSCMSGMNKSQISQGVHGLIGAFSAAGAHYVVSHLWEAKDLTTPIFMDAFYYHYVVKKQSPPAALSSARKYMQQIKVGELKRDHWFELDRYDILDQSSKSELLRLINMPDSVRPFRSETYWAGFACYQCY